MCKTPSPKELVVQLRNSAATCIGGCRPTARPSRGWYAYNIKPSSHGPAGFLRADARTPINEKPG